MFEAVANYTQRFIHEASASFVMFVTVE